jgi:hypothetical protein
MLAVKARFDGRKVVLPRRRPKASPGTVLVIFSEARDNSREKRAWLKAQEKTFAKVWDNDEDAVYDNM